MFRKVVSVMLLVVFVSAMLNFPFNVRKATAETSPMEQQIVALVNGSRTYDVDLQLENITYTYPAFRTSGSRGANATAYWIKSQFESFGMEAWLEPFTFKTWDLTDQPSLVIDEDGNPATTNDQTTISSFMCDPNSCPTSLGGTFADLVVLPLPEAANESEIGKNPINMTAWNAIDTTDKIVAVGKQVYHIDFRTYVNKILSQPPKAVITFRWYDWEASYPRSITDTDIYRFTETSSGSVDYADGALIRNMEATVNVSAKVCVNSVHGNGDNYNVVGRISGYKNPEKSVIISGHYDALTCAGFCDNGAGTAGVLELANVFSEAVRTGAYRPRYTLLFVTFTAEEPGLVGSAYYVAQHKNEMADIVAVVNLDCIGSDNLCISETDPNNGLDMDDKHWDNHPCGRLPNVYMVSIGKLC